MHDPDGLSAAIRTGEGLVIYLHDNPDPDALAAGWLLYQIAEALGRSAVMLFGGRLGRAENRAMVRLLKIPASRVDSSGFRQLETDVFALVDTQPRAENNSFPDDLEAAVVIDHHPPRPDLAATFLDVRAEEGCCTTMLLGYHQALGLELDPDVATAAAYAIISETQDLEREATQADRLAYQRLIPLVRLTTLGRIRHPARERAYYRTIARAMQHVALAKNTCVCHIGRVPYPEVVAEVADFLVAMKHVTWCLVSGLHEDSMAVSLRTTHPNAQADQVMKRILGDEGKGGGHSTMAGGALPCASEELYRERSTLLVERLVQQLSLRPSTRFRPLLGDDEDRVDQTGTPFRVKE